MEMKLKLWQLKQRQSLPLSAKVNMSLKRIKEFYEHNKGNVCVSFSGGKDSTALLHLVRSIYPDVKAVFVNTGLEFPEIVEFARKTKNIDIIYPEMNFKQVIDKCGYPVISKKIATMIGALQNPSDKNESERNLYLTGVRKDGRKSSGTWILPKRWEFLVEAPFKISDECCDIMKKKPFAKYTKETGLHTYVGTLASESRLREISYLNYGCNSFTGKIQSRPLSFWMEEDIWNYIKKNKIKYCSIYDKGQDRTGCMFCMFGIHLEGNPNKFQCMKKTHPQLYEYCMKKLQLKKVLDYIGCEY